MTTELYPPGPKSILPFGYSSVVKLVRDPIGFLMGLARYGDMAHYKVAKTEIYFVNHPDYIREVLVTKQRNFTKGNSVTLLKDLIGEGLLTSEGDFHLRQRRLAQPAFHKKRIAAYADIMSGYADKRQQNWEAGQTFDMAEEMRLVTLAIVTKTLFDTDVEGENKELAESLDALHDWAERVLLPLPLAKLMGKLPIRSTSNFNKGRKYLDAKMYEMIKERRASGEDQGDLLSMLIQALDEEGDHTGMSDAQVHDEVLTFFLAGHETTALALTWTWYLLSQHPEVEAKLHAELDSVLGGRLPTIEDLPRLPYTEMVFAEAMRLYPPAYATSRWTVTETKLGDYTLPPQSLVLISPYVMHRDPRYFPDPEKFDPERWTPEKKAKLPKLAYFPFGAGARLCIGEPFAWMEGELILATLAQRWQMRLVPGHPVKLDPLITLRAKYGMQMTLQRREPKTESLITQSSNIEVA